MIFYFAKFARIFEAIFRDTPRGQGGGGVKVAAVQAALVVLVKM